MSCPFACAEKIFSNRIAMTVAGVAAAVVVGKAIVETFRQRRAADATAARRASQKPGVVYLYQWPRSSRLHSLSTFCTIVETYLRLTGVEHEVVDVRDASMSPSGRLPYVELNGVGTCDSEFIIQRLERELKGGLEDGSPTATTTTAAAGGAPAAAAPLDDGLSTLVVRTLNHSIRLHMLRHLWVDNTAVMRAEFTSAGRAFNTPSFIVTLLCRSARSRGIVLLNAEGQGDLSDAEYHAKFLADAKAVESVLAAATEGKARLSTGAVATIFTYVSYLWIAPNCPAVSHLKQSAVVRAFMQTTDGTAFPDAAERVPGRAPFTA